MNTELLNQVKEAIRSEPNKFHMDCYFGEESRQGGVQQDTCLIGNLPNLTDHQCKTTACIAGWALFLKHGPVEYKSIIKYDQICEAAEEVLEIDDEQAIRLFYQCDWPEQFINGDPSDVENACARIDHFIATDGDE